MTKPRSGSTKSWLSNPLVRITSGFLGLVTAGAVGTVTYAATNPFLCKLDPAGKSISNVNIPSANGRCVEQSLRAEIKAQQAADDRFNNDYVNNYNQEVRNRTSLSGEFIPTANIQEAVEFYAKNTDPERLKQGLRIEDLPTILAQPGDNQFGQISSIGTTFGAAKRLRYADTNNGSKVIPPIGEVRNRLAYMPEPDREKLLQAVFQH
ncbi:MAG: hypothetical protein KGO93_05045 [Cyanobacteria bacterium REEB446]|nr:hypothetical protein [Cyanobacteria bacterium REEB446]